LLVTGASGLLGNKTVAFAEQDYLVTPTDVTEPLHPNAVKADITDSSGVTNLFRKLKPDIVIHTASETNVDRCETEKERAWKINAEGTRNIAEACRETNAKLICISTDYVFDGEKGLYTEEDCPNPINHYGITKLEGEKHVIRNCKNYAVLRTSVLYGRHPWKQEFSGWIINKLKQNQEITVVDDHFNTPTLADSLARMALEVGTRDLRGIFHTSGCERISRYEFAKQIAKTFDLDSDLIKPIKMNELKAWVAKRPKDSSLSTEKIQKQLRTKPLNINEGLQRLKAEMEKSKA
jgi:dTDP-4-dehydrorhamnose reductase